MDQQRSGDTFTRYNPLVNFVFFIGAILFGMFFIHPVFLIIALTASISYYITIKKSKSIKLLFILIPMFIFLSVINPFFNTYGETILFVYWGRAYTLEALLYGMSTAAMFVSIIIWFSCYNAVMTSDKFLYLFGKMIPSLSLVFTMTLRLVPNFQKKITQIILARKCIGKSGQAETKREQAEDGLVIVSSLTSWALESAVITADSMKSRGYGSGLRTNFSIYRFDRADKILLVIMLILCAGILYYALNGATQASYTPVFNIASINQPKTLVTSVMYFILLMIPTTLNIKEEIVWRILRSKI